MVDGHIHTHTCWQSGDPECMKHRIEDLEALLATIQGILRKVGGQMDRIDGNVSETLQEGKIML